MSYERLLPADEKIDASLVEESLRQTLSAEQAEEVMGGNPDEYEGV